MSSTAAARADLATVISVGMPPSADGVEWSVYAEPPTGVHAPAIALGPGDPYRESGAYRLDDVRLRVTVLLAEQQESPLDRVDDALDELLAILRRVPICAVDRVSQVGRIIEVGGVGYLAAVVEVTLGIERSRVGRTP